ncbi:MAG: hypothetical protein ACRD5I_14535, partial [Candidatus Acidiferrales bacterium]
HRQYNRWVKAVDEMLARTNTPHAPWTVIAANDLRWARVRVFETLVERMEEAVARRHTQPAAVSRTTAAAAATMKDRAARAARDSQRAREEEKRTTEAGVLEPAAARDTE